MKIIGITGGVGAGKSEVLSFLEEEYGALVIQADRVGHRLMEPGTEVYRAILEKFGREVLQEDGQVNRSTLGQIIFADAEKREALNAIVHPAVKGWIRREISREEKAGKLRLLFIEAALLIEDHYEELCHEFWYIYAAPKVRRERLKASRGYTDEKITAIFDSQQPEEVFRAHCQVVIDNSGSKEETRAQIRTELKGRGWNLRKGEKGT